ncbi:nuclear transport factor 2 family protein [Shewanella insulae]|uniref:nuclear transport factor 2 family protein n=1 Tax=Shewanella insulae TaxID=2681496 RepID=UPI00248132F1|nr:nuclear transport factor 2 family protein [Shewanella insulae]
MRQTIIELELALLSPEMRSDANVLDELIHADFLEVGATGISFGKPEVLARLPKEKSPAFKVSDMQCRFLSENLAQLHYRACFKPVNEVDKRYSLRTSLWKCDGGRWQMIYHQGTPCAPFF